MLKSTSVLGVVSILLCFNLNYTFPYHRGNSKWNIFRGNHSNYCENSNAEDRTKKTASITENTLKIIESTATVPTESPQSKSNINRKSASKEDDLSHYEQMVIMKKNPYLDLKELEQRLYNGGAKHVRASMDVGICDEGPCVEIVNRGLTGFALPTKLIKSIGKPKEPPVPNPAAPAAPIAADDLVLGDKVSKKTEQEDKLTNLVKDIKKFEETKLLL